LAPRKLDPDSQECKDLAKKIDNIRKQIDSRQTDIMYNSGGLPVLPPYSGAPSKASVFGHQKIIDDLKAVLQRRINEYAEKCGCDDSPGGCSTGGGTPNGSPSPGMSTAAKIGVGAVGAACVIACTLQPELCLPVLILGGTAAR
jgi:hypothetical protein